MKYPRTKLRLLTVLGAVAIIFPTAAMGTHSSIAHAAGTPFVLTLSLAGTTTPVASTMGPDGGAQDTEIDSALNGSDSDADGGDGGDTSGVNRTIVAGPGNAANAHASQKAKSNPELQMTMQGLNFHAQRFANGGNQFSVEPPDQGLCAGNGYVLESTNDVMRVYDTNGNAKSGVVDLNTFYGYAAAINRAANPLTFGQSVTDPSCYYDPDTQRWFHVVLSLDRAAPTTQGLSGANHLDIAVSTTSSPLGSWVIYRLPVQNDGSQGTPNHGCVQRVRINGVIQLVPGPCLGDYPHIGADANGFYITTNEFDLASPGHFHGAQIYALSKQQLAANAQSVNVALWNTADPNSGVQLNGQPGFTVWPAVSPAGNFDTDNNGTEYLMSSDAVFQNDGFDNRIQVWSITNSASLSSASPSPSLSMTVENVEGYGVPPSSAQKAGDTPLASCVADPTCAPAVGAAVRPNSETRVPSNDSRMQQVIYANGKLWGALDTGLVFNDDPSHVWAGIAYFVVRPTSQGAGAVATQGYVGIPGNNVTYPALAVTPSGRGVLAFTVVGPDYYPSAGYTSLDAKLGAGDVHVSAPGAGPEDGFTAYAGLANPVRPRWGDYGAAVADGNTVWIASEYVAQTCTYAQFRADTTCGGTRGALGNWSTSLSKLGM